jgi:hypothetical protein
LHKSFSIRIEFLASEVDTGSREEKRVKQKIRASVLIQSEPIGLKLARDGVWVQAFIVSSSINREPT